MTRKTVFFYLEKRKCEPPFSSYKSVCSQYFSLISGNSMDSGFNNKIRSMRSKNCRNAIRDPTNDSNTHEEISRYLRINDIQIKVLDVQLPYFQERRSEVDYLYSAGQKIKTSVTKWNKMMAKEFVSKTS